MFVSRRLRAKGIPSAVLGVRFGAGFADFGVVVEELFDFLGSVAWPDWIGAVSNAALVLLACIGLNIWRRQAIAQRDHDVAIRVMQSLTKCWMELVRLRVDGPLLEDVEEPIEAVGLTEGQHRYLTIRARYRGRVLRLDQAVQERTALVVEFLETVGDTTVVETLGELSALENRVKVEAFKFVHHLHYDPDEPPTPPDLSVLFAPPVGDPDPVDAQYAELRQRVGRRLGPALRMERRRRKPAQG